MASGRHSAKARAKERKDQERSGVRRLATGKGVGGTNDEFEYVREKPKKSRSKLTAPKAPNIEFSNPKHVGQRLTPPQGYSSVGNWDYSGQPAIMSKRRTRAKRSKVILIVLAVIVLVGSGVGFWAHGQIDPSNQGRKPLVVVVPTGATGASVADILAKKGIISSSVIFRLYMRVYPVTSIQPGPFAFFKHEKYSEIESTLKKGPDQTLLDYRLTVPEGFTSGQIAQLVGKLPGHTAGGFESALASGKLKSNYIPANGNLEGLLFPDTYFISRDESDLEIAQQMLDRFNQIASQVNLNSLANGLGLSPYQVITVASIVQREAITPSDMAKVAEVIYNRLKAKMNLQIDSTVIYALATMGQTVTSEITISQEKTPSPYNTYLHPGLPPSPISAPGEMALQASLHPTQGPWLYYVTIDKQGDEAFSSTLAQQNANIALAKRNGA